MGVDEVSSPKASASSPELASTIDQASALAELPDPLFIMKAVRDPDGTVVEFVYAFLNEAAARLYGMRVDEVLGHGQCELFPSVRELGIWDTYLGVLNSGSPASFDVPYFKEHSVEGSFRLTATKFRDGLLISANDITEQVAAEKERDADQAVLRATVDSLLDPVVRLGAERDESGEIVDFVFEDANPAACEYNKMTYEQLIGARLLDVFPGQAGTGLFEMYRHVIEADEPLVLDDFVYPQELMGGEKRHYDIRAAHVAGDWLTYTWRDVTERQSQRELAEQLHRDRQRLDELERFQHLTVERELKMIELKKEIENLKEYGAASGGAPGEQVGPD
jgi:PAS domain-containing protein